MSEQGRKQKAKKNLVFNILNQILTIGIGLLIPRLVLTSYGSAVNGYVNSVTQIYSYIALVEAGIGAASMQALYKPVAENDRDSINSIVAATSQYYRRAGFVYLGLIVLFAIIYPIAINSEIDYFTMIAIIILNGLGGVINFFFQGKYRILLQAEGKNYVLTNLASCVHLLTGISKIVLMLLGCNVVVLQFAYFLVSVLQMIYIMWYMKRHYRWIDLNVKPNYHALDQKNGVLINQITYLIFNNTDTILLSMFCGLPMVSVYSMYMLCYNMVRTAIETVTGSISFAMGQIFNTDKQRYIQIHDTYESGQLFLTFSLYTVANIMILPFLKLYTNGVTDVNYIDNGLPILFTSMCLLSAMRGASGNVISYAGHFKQTQWRAVAEAIINVTFTIGLIIPFGIKGAIWGTIIALLYRTNDIIIYANKKLLGRSPLKTYIKCMTNTTVFFIINSLQKLIMVPANNYLSWLMSAVCVSLTSILIYGTVNALIDRKSTERIFKYFCGKFTKIEE